MPPAQVQQLALVHPHAYSHHVQGRRPLHLAASAPPASALLVAPTATLPLPLRGEAQSLELVGAALRTGIAVPGGRGRVPRVLVAPGHAHAGAAAAVKAGQGERQRGSERETV